MVSKEDIKKELDTCKRPLFIFDDDADGLASFLLLYRYVKEGKGMPLKTAGGVDEALAEKVNEYGPDKVFITDIPMVSQEFIDNVNCKVIWIDHHPIQKRQNVTYYNPLLTGKSKPASQLCYEIVNQDLWIAMTGTVADWVFDKKLVNKFRKEYLDLLPEKISTPEKALFDSKIGLLAKIFNFVLKGPIFDVKKRINVLTRIESPYEILNQTTPAGKFIYKNYEYTNKFYDALLKKALKTKGKMLVFTYSEEISFTGELSNELLYKFPEKVIIVSREKSGWMRSSLRSSKFNIRDALEKALVGVEGGGGGHEHACGASIKKEHWETFLDNLKKELNL